MVDKIKSKQNQGLSMIEMIIYIAIVSIISTSITGLYIHIIRLRSLASASQEVNESIRLAASKIDYEIRQAKAINSVGTSLSLFSNNSARNPTIIDLNNGRIRFSVGSSTAYITSNLVNINAFTLTNLSTGDSKSQNVRYTISGTYLGSSASITSSSEVRSK
jgi:type II secretory pathway pseudopilin PulG